MHKTKYFWTSRRTDIVQGNSHKFFFSTAFRKYCLISKTTNDILTRLNSLHFSHQSRQHLNVILFYFLLTIEITRSHPLSGVTLQAYEWSIGNWYVRWGCFNKQVSLLETLHFCGKSSTDSRIIKLAGMNSHVKLLWNPNLREAQELESTENFLDIGNVSSPLSSPSGAIICITREEYSGIPAQKV